MDEQIQENLELDEENSLSFVLHRLIKDRNRYTVGCYKEGRKPVLPSAKFGTKDE